MVDSVVADANGGVIVTFNFGSEGNPQSAFADAFPSILNLSGFTDFEVNVTLLPGSGSDGVDFQQFVHGGSSDDYFFVTHYTDPVTIAGGTTLADFNLVAGFANATPPGVPVDAEVGFQVFPHDDAPVSPSTAADQIEIDPVLVPEPVSLSLLALSGLGLLGRRRGLA